jgi:hypothetical protein
MVFSDSDLDLGCGISAERAAQRLTGAAVSALAQPACLCQLAARLPLPVDGRPARSAPFAGRYHRYCSRKKLLMHHHRPFRIEPFARGCGAAFSG